MVLADFLSVTIQLNLKIKKKKGKKRERIEIQNQYFHKKTKLSPEILNNAKTINHIDRTLCALGIRTSIGNTARENTAFN